MRRIEHFDIINDVMSADEKKFVAFWGLVFGSAVGFWVVIIRWAISVLT